MAPPSAGAWCAVLTLRTPTHAGAANAITMQHLPKKAYGTIFVQEVVFVLSHAAIEHSLDMCAHAGRRCVG